MFAIDSRLTDGVRLSALRAGVLGVRQNIAFNKCLYCLIEFCLYICLYTRSTVCIYSYSCAKNTYVVIEVLYTITDPTRMPFLHADMSVTVVQYLIFS
jgi:hypothetical protein